MCTGGFDPVPPGPATADIVAYGGTPSVKVGREFLLKFLKKDGKKKS